ncbi:MAG: hypothetical protein NT166_03810 [Candidatus Aminicenantes bacterium]|nr:hypothetical protein [Candidatus Aminicenantes bacterium]
MNIKAKTKKLETPLSFLCLIFLATLFIFDQPVLHLNLFKDVIFGFFYIFLFLCFIIVRIPATGTAEFWISQLEKV